MNLEQRRWREGTGQTFVTGGVDGPVLFQVKDTGIGISDAFQ